MITLTTEQARQIEEAILDELEAQTCEEFSFAAEKLDAALAVIRAAKEQANRHQGFEKVKLNPEYDLGIGRGSMAINRWVDDGKFGITGVNHDWDKIFTPKEQRLVAEQALQKLSDFHQSIEHDGHWSDCSTHNEPAYPNGECDCGGYPAKQERKMNPDEILKLARKAGIIIRNGRLDVKPNVDLLGSLEHFAKLVLWSDALFQSLIAGERAAEREACAKVCDELNKLWPDEGGTPDSCAAAIRARGRVISDEQTTL